MASSSSSHQQNRELNAFSGIEPAGKRRKVCESLRLFDVFINHRGPDVKQTLATELYNSLGQLGIEVFLDSQEKELGNSFLSTIETAIRSAKVHIAIFSKGYAESPWCLAELVLMIETKAKIIPVFYEVEPWELRYIEKGAYADAFIKYKEKDRYLEKLNDWREALQTLSFTAGEVYHSSSDCKTIVAAAVNEVQRKQFLHVAKYPVGLNYLVEDFERQSLDELVKDFENQRGLQKNKSNVVGIFGMGGLGKTTLAKELFNRKRSNYSGASFLFDVREAFVRRELPLLQSQLVKDLFRKEQSFRSIEEGTSYLKDSLKRSPILDFLIVVDDIDHVDQLDALSVMDILNKSDNSLVIVTTRDVGVVISAGITLGYPLKGMDRNHGRQLFCWHAFDQPLPYTAYEELVDQFVDMCGGLPLSLQVLGRLVRGRPQSYWELKLIKGRETLPRDIKQRLRISFDALNDDEKQVYMDIACFFLGKPKRMAETILEGSGWDAQNALETLKDKCLVEEISVWGQIVLRMHDHLRDLGREMALELSSPRRLWHPRDLESLELTDLKTILAQTNVRCFHFIFEDSMGCSVTFFLCQSDSCVETPASILWLELEGENMIEQPSIPSWIPLQKLQFFKIQGGRFKTLWKNHTQIFPYRHQLSTSCRDLRRVSGSGEPTKLRELTISDCPELEELPNLSRLNCMENIEIHNCERLQNIMPPTTLIRLSVHSCRDLQRISGSGDLIKLTELFISDSPKIEELPTLSRMSCLERIEIYDCEKLQNITLPTTLISLSVESCRDLQRISGSGDLIKLTELFISQCPKLEELPSLSRVSCMERIKIHDCEKLQNITLPTTLISLSVKSRRDLKRISGSGDLIKCTELFISECPKLEELPSLSRVSCMERIKIHDCEKLQNITLPTTLISLSVESCRDLQRISGSGDLIKLTELFIGECPKLEELPILSRVSCLERITIHDFEKLQNITLPTTLISLSVERCRDLQRISGSGDLIKLTELFIGECPKLEELPILSRVSCLERITIHDFEKLQNITLPTKLISLSVERCRDLQRISGSGDLIKLTELFISQCPKLEELPSLSRVSCMERIKIHDCEKLQNIMLPPTLISVSVLSCRDLQRVVGDGGLIKLTKLIISECPELEELGSIDLIELTELIISECPELENLPRLSRLSCMEEVKIHSCQKLQSITLPTTVSSLSIHNCRDLQRVEGSGDLIKLKELIITECPELEELLSLSRLSCVETIEIESSEKLEKILGFKELHALQWMRLGHCSNAVIRNCIHKLKIVPSLGMHMIGRAVDGAESSLNEDLFWMANIGVIEIGSYESFSEWSGLSAAVIGCYVVVIDSSTSAEDINKSLIWLGLREGEWIITIVANDEQTYSLNYGNVEDVLSRKGIIKKRFRGKVRKGEEWESVGVLHAIVDRLYQ